MATISIEKHLVLEKFYTGTGGLLDEDKNIHDFLPVLKPHLFSRGALKASSSRTRSLVVTLARLVLVSADDSGCSGRRPRLWSETGHFLTMPLFSGKLGVFLSRMERVSDSSKLSSTKKLLATPLGDC